jgi:hypothetical protein
MEEKISGLNGYFRGVASALFSWVFGQNLEFASLRKKITM